jgi:hypothetical protein
VARTGLNAAVRTAVARLRGEAEADNTIEIYAGAVDSGVDDSVSAFAVYSSDGRAVLT